VIKNYVRILNTDMSQFSTDMSLIALQGIRPKHMLTTGRCPKTNCLRCVFFTN